MTAAANATRDSFQPPSMLGHSLNGDAELRKIAKAGRQWMFEVGRKIDMESECCASISVARLTGIVYVYRLCLEWARLYSDDREAMSYKG